jgi:hypothetical protein
LLWDRGVTFEDHQIWVVRRVDPNESPKRSM